MKKIQEIIDNDQDFITYSNEFDRVYSTMTYVADLSLREIWDEFMVKNSPDQRWYGNTPAEYAHEIIASKIADTFTDRNIVYSDDVDITGGMIGKFNSLYLMKTDINNGKGFYNPISISNFENGQSSIHPGGTRLMFSDIYHGKIPCILTFYGDNNTTLENLQPLENFSFSFGASPLMMVTSSTDSPYASSAHDKALNAHLYDHTGKVIPGDRIIKPYKQIVDYHIQDKDYTYHRPTTINPPRKFELRGDNLYGGDMLLATKIEDIWKIVL